MGEFQVACAALSIPYESTLLMQGTQYPTCNLVMPQLYQMITKLEMSSITYVHTARKETITIRAKLYICTLLDPRFKNYNMWPTRKYVTTHTYAQRVCSVAKLNDRG